MKKILLAYGALVVVVVLLAFAKFNGFSFLSSFGGKSVVINNHSYKLLIANDDKTRQVGLSKRKSLDKNTGMLFVFQKKGIYSFWMKDTEIPLDMLFIDGDKIIYIVKNAPPQAGKSGLLPIYTPPSEINYVLELNGGEVDKNKIKTGDKITLKGVK